MIMVAFPLYLEVPAPVFSNWLSMNKADVLGTIVVNGAYITTAMSMIVESALRHDGWDRLVIFEADMLPPHDALSRIACYAPELDVVGSFYFRHEKPHNIHAYIEQPDLSYGPLTPTTITQWHDEPGVYPVDAVGFGFTSITRRVLENWDPSIPMFHIDDRFGSHDLWFCYHARKQGFHVFADSGVVCGHLSQVTVDLADNQAAAPLTESADTITFQR